MRRKRGFVQIAILHLLKESSMHGYQIMKELEERSGGVYKSSAGTVYPALQELLDTNQIELSDADSDKKIYCISEKGQKRLMEHAERAEGDFWSEWVERVSWRQSKEYERLTIALNKWEHDLKITVKKLHKHPQNTDRLISILEETTDRLKKEFNR
ncbi:PadR family transcriptional regulator [Caldibacillus lycopersici]|uniref:PadR family transcriptional regulator n=1 Tax=Perspicuibacillus lycopersici TaxID=1325689 RepID=A0AAE3IQC7_9BACI|nr:PadR family transcriptional regulator [Perspicuibacillus lycopersici]MCU9612650.1 PadR family transcriptional regulator [Perspicuibacillus lycopersici]